MSALIGVVGPCAAGKSTLITGLRAHGYRAKHIAQEHSYVQAMWQKLTNPDILIFLNVSYPQSVERRQLNWTSAEYETQLSRLSHAHQYADLIIQTDDLAIEQVLEIALIFLKEHGI
jgi:ABC-type cobalamin/Fe3+-siderophores transport system ATPase subunit